MIIGLTGPIGCGKTTAANILCEHHGYIELAFKEGLIGPLCTLFGVEPSFFEDRDTKEVPSNRLLGRTPREVMQSYGTDWARGMVHPDIWVENMRRRLTYYPGQPTVISDVRFNNEARFIRDSGGVVVYMNRLGLESASKHTSEDGIDKDLVDREVPYSVPSDGDTDELAFQLEGLLHEIR